MLQVGAMVHGDQEAAQRSRQDGHGRRQSCHCLEDHQSSPQGESGEIP